MTIADKTSDTMAPVPRATIAKQAIAEYAICSISVRLLVGCLPAVGAVPRCDRQRGNNYFERAGEQAPNVLNFQFEPVMSGRDLPRPVNYDWCALSRRPTSRSTRESSPLSCSTRVPAKDSASAG
jgi:hypothetical protein